MLPSHSPIKHLQDLDEQERKLIIDRELTLRKAYNSGDVNTIYKAEQYYTSLQKRVDPNYVKGQSNNPVKSLILDPQEVATSMGYYSKPSIVSDHGLRQMARTPVISAIIRTRCNQVADFLKPQADKYSKGFLIRKKGVKKDDELTDNDKRNIDMLTEFMLHCGEMESKWKWDKLDIFGRKVIADSLIMDKACLLPGAYVEMADGTACKIENIIAGQQVRTHTDSSQEVVETKTRIYNGEFVDIYVRGQKLSVTGTHPILCARKTSHLGNVVELNPPRWIAASDIDEFEYVVYPKMKVIGEKISLPIFHENPRKYLVAGDFDLLVKEVGLHKVYVKGVLTENYHRWKKFSITENNIQLIKDKARELGVVYDYKRKREPVTEIDNDWAYMIGIYLAEGSIHKNSVCFTFHEKETDRINFVVDFFNKYGVSSNIYNYSNRKGTCVFVSSGAVVNFLLNNFSKGSANKIIAPFIFRCSEQIIVNLLKGYLGGDGWVRENLICFSTTSKNLFYGIRRLLSSQGIYIVERREKQKQEIRKVQYKANISGVNYKTLAKKMGFPFDFDKEERRAYIEDKDNLYIKVSDVEKYYDKQTVYNLEVKDDHSYIANGFVNHNCFEIVPYRSLEAYCFVAVDAATMMIADSYDNETHVNDSIKIKGEYPSYVQVYQNRIIREFYPWEMCFGIRNPSTNIHSNGYGRSELEDLITNVTGMLNADQYNNSFFRQGSSPKGMLMIKKAGAAVNGDRIAEFRKSWNAQMSGVGNSHKTAMLDAEGFEWIDLSKTNKDMEFFKYIEYLVKVGCAVFNISPEEIGFPIEGQGSGGLGGSGDGKEEKEYSKDKGLKPLLTSLQGWINDFIIGPKTNNTYEFVFTGIQTESAKDEEERLLKAVDKYLTPDEIRKEKGLKPLPDGLGAMPLSPIMAQMKMMASQQQQGQYDQSQQDQQQQDEQDNEQFNNTNPFLDKGNKEDSPFVKAFDQFVEKEMILK